MFSHQWAVVCSSCVPLPRPQSLYNPNSSRPQGNHREWFLFRHSTSHTIRTQLIVRRIPLPYLPCRQKCRLPVIRVAAIVLDWIRTLTPFASCNNFAINRNVSFIIVNRFCQLTEYTYLFSNSTITPSRKTSVTTPCNCVKIWKSKISIRSKRMTRRRRCCDRRPSLSDDQQLKGK